MSEPNKPKSSLGVEGAVSRATLLPYILLFQNEKQIVQLRLSDARSFAIDILNACARTEADAGLARLFKKHDLPDGAYGAMMLDVREIRYEQDMDVAEKFQSVPTGDQFDFTKKKTQ